MKNLSKYIIAGSIGMLLCAPIAVIAATAVPWTLSSLTDTAIVPALVNGSNKGIRIQGTATSSFLGNVGFGLTNPNRAQVECQATTTTSGSHCFTAWDSNGANIFDINGSGTATVGAQNARFGIGTTSPWGEFGIHADNGSTLTQLFTIASSTASATTTLLSFNNTGLLGIGVDTATILANSLGGNVPANGTGLVVNSPVVNGAGGISFASNGTFVGLVQANPAFMTFNTGNNNTGYRFLDQNGVLMNLSGTGTLTIAPNGGATQPFVGIGTSSPFAELSIATPNGSNGAQQTLFAIASSTSTGTTTLFAVASSGWVVTSGTLPTASPCGSTQNVSGNQTNGTVFFTGTLVTSCTVNFPIAVPTGTTLQCTESDNSLAATADISATTTSSVTFGLSTGLAAGAITWHCEASRNANN